MEWLNRLRDSIDYLERNMESKLDMDAAAKVALTSKFHFQRLFHMTTGVTVAEYVRKRRLTLAAQELTASDLKVIDIALKYGYQTPEAFCKAFQKVHGVNPSEAREFGNSLKAYPRISFQIQIKGDKEMNYRIVEKEAFKIAGKAEKVSCADGKHHAIISGLWNDAFSSGLDGRLASFAGELGLLGVCMDFDYEKDELTYVIAAEKTQAEVPADLTALEIPAATWAIFESVGPLPGAIQEVWGRVYSEWFPATGYEQANAPSIESYPMGDTTDSSYKCEVWVPIVKR